MTRQAEAAQRAITYERLARIGREAVARGWYEQIAQVEQFVELARAAHREAEAL